MTQDKEEQSKNKVINRTFCNRCYKPYEWYEGKLWKMCPCDESYQSRELRFREL